MALQGGDTAPWLWSKVLAKKFIEKKTINERVIF